jgi:hypothetical protein
MCLMGLGPFVVRSCSLTGLCSVVSAAKKLAVDGDGSSTNPSILAVPRNSDLSYRKEALAREEELRTVNR